MQLPTGQAGEGDADCRLTRRRYCRNYGLAEGWCRELIEGGRGRCSDLQPNEGAGIAREAQRRRRSRWVSFNTYPYP